MAFSVCRFEFVCEKCTEVAKAKAKAPLQVKM